MFPQQSDFRYVTQPGTWIKHHFVRIHLSYPRRWYFDTSFGRRQWCRVYWHPGRHRKIAKERKLSKSPDIWRVFIRYSFDWFEKRTSGTRQCEVGCLYAIYLCGFKNWLHALSVRYRDTTSSLGIGFTYFTILGGAQSATWQQFWHVPIFVDLRSVFVFF